MKICHMTSVHEQLDDRIFEKECVSLAKKGFETYLVAQGDSRIEQGVYIIGCNEKPIKRIKRILFFTRSIYRQAKLLNCQIYHIHDPELLPYALLLKKQGKKVIFDSHENYTLQILRKKYIPKLFRAIMSKIYYVFESYILRQIDAVIVPCTFNGRNLYENRCKNAEIIANYPIVQEARFINEKKKKKSICYTGGLSRDRGIIELIQAAYEANVKLILAGKFENNEFEKEVKQLKAFKNVDYRGYVDREQVNEIYEESMIGMCLLKNTGQYHSLDILPVKVYEYMERGLPVILNDSVYNRKIIEKYQFGRVVKENNIDDIVKEIVSIIENSEERKEMGRRGNSAIHNSLNWECESKKLVNLYKKIVREKYE